MTPTCLDLRQLFGETYRIGHDPAAVTRSEKNDPWMATIPCRLGTIYPHGGDTLAVEIDGHPGVARKVAAIAGVRLHQEGDREKTYLFQLDLFPQVAALVKPRRRRKLSE